MTTKKWTIRKIIRTVWITGGMIFIAWLFYSYQAHGVAEKFFQNSQTTQVEENSDYFLFTPTSPFKEVLIFYPGAMVDPEAYVPLCRKTADSNIQVYLVKMPWRLAVNGYNKPKELHLFKDSTKAYILSGHSQGAKMAA